MSCFICGAAYVAPSDNETFLCPLGADGLHAWEPIENDIDDEATQPMGNWAFVEAEAEHLEPIVIDD